MSVARLKGILTLTDPVAIRDALECHHSEPRPTDKGDHIYPKGGWLGAYLAYSRESNAPSAYHFWTGVSLLGAAMRRNVYLPLGPYKLFPNHYLMVVGDSAIGKGTAFGIGEPIIHRANDLVVDYFKEFHWAPGIECPPDRRVKVLEKILTPERMLETLPPTDVDLDVEPDNPEMPVKLVGDDSVGMLMNEELVSLAAKHLHGSSGLFHLITALYSCPEIPFTKGTVTRKNNTLRNVALTVALGSTLEWINKSITPDMFEGGFMSRCMFCYRTREYERHYYHYDIAPPQDPVLKGVLARTLVPWMVLGPARACIFTKGARALWTTICDFNQKAMGSATDPRLIPYYRRRDNHIGKLAMVLMASDLIADFETFDLELLEARPSFTLTEDILHRAMKIVEREEEYMPECFAKIGEHQDSSRLDTLVAHVKRLNEERDGPAPLYLVNRRAKEVFGLEGPKNLLIMEGMGVIKKVTVVSGGRPAVGYVATGWTTQVCPPFPKAGGVQPQTESQGSERQGSPAPAEGD
jgi:hypothetical protein